MIEPQTTALILLAAGRSTRFGGGNKLAQPWRGLPLGLHAAKALEPVPFARRIAVTSAGDPGYRELRFDVVSNPTPEAGLSSSIRLGIAAARAGPIQAVVVALADMPRVTAAQILRLFALQHGPSTIVASRDGPQAKPPVLFGANLFADLERLSGDRGARDLLRSGRLAEGDPHELVDIDNMADLENLRSEFGV